jgi:hypothetical protein
MHSAQLDCTPIKLHQKTIATPHPAWYTWRRSTNEHYIRTGEQINGRAPSSIREGPTDTRKCCSRGENAALLGLLRKEPVQTTQPAGWPVPDSLPNLQPPGPSEQHEQHQLRQRHHQHPPERHLHTYQTGGADLAERDRQRTTPGADPVRQEDLQVQTGKFGQTLVGNDWGRYDGVDE